MSTEELRMGIVDSHEKTQESLAALANAHSVLIEAASTYGELGKNTQSTKFSDAKTQTLEACENLGQISSDLVGYPEALNPYLDRLGLQPLNALARPTLANMPSEGGKDYAPKSESPHEGTQNTQTESQDNDEMQERYTNMVNDIDAQLATGKNPKEIDNFVGQGGLSYVYKDKERNVVVKLPRVYEEVEWEQDGEEHFADVPPSVNTINTALIEPLKKGKGVDGLEQIVTVIDHEGVAGKGAVVCEFAPGKTWNKLSPDEQLDIPDTHYDRLMDTLEEMGNRGLLIDNDPENFIYDPEKGFTIIDYQLQETRYSEGEVRDGAAQARLIQDHTRYPGALASPNSTLRHETRLRAAMIRKFGPRK